ncbi:MAG: hypothetical protein KKI02_07600 [Planctomycetes bacterium]|nr:hypothetical protein [Planctomycetota bacterium]
MKRNVAIGIALALFSSGAVVNSVYAALIGNYKCYKGTCTAITQRCIQLLGTCTWCFTPHSGDYCGEFREESCASTGSKDCGGTRYTGSCIDNICTGLLNPQSGCIQPKCADGEPYPGPGTD